ncbi:MAG TPA: hypothetical protein VNE21_03795, partial [Mycobacteriales bacterium]|nr:hypothetical protein [Mycobacteriales bacterium]
RLWGLVALLSGRTDEQVKDFFAHGMLLNVIAALDATALDEPWARCCTPVLQRSAPAAQAASGQAR